MKENRLVYLTTAERIALTNQALSTTPAKTGAERASVTTKTGTKTNIEDVTQSTLNRATTNQTLALPQTILGSQQTQATNIAQTRGALEPSDQSKYKASVNGTTQYFNSYNDAQQAGGVGIRQYVAPAPVTMGSNVPETKTIETVQQQQVTPGMIQQRVTFSRKPTADDFGGIEAITSDTNSAQALRKALDEFNATGSFTLMRDVAEGLPNWIAGYDKTIDQVDVNQDKYVAAVENQVNTGVVSPATEKVQALVDQGVPQTEAVNQIAQAIQAEVDRRNIERAEEMMQEARFAEGLPSYIQKQYDDAKARQSSMGESTFKAPSFDVTAYENFTNTFGVNDDITEAKAKLNEVLSSSNYKDQLKGVINTDIYTTPEEIKTAILGTGTNFEKFKDEFNATGAEEARAKLDEVLNSTNYKEQLADIVDTDIYTTPDEIRNQILGAGTQFDLDLNTPEMQSYIDEQEYLSSPDLQQAFQQLMGTETAPTLEEVKAQLGVSDVESLTDILAGLADTFPEFEDIYNVQLQQTQITEAGEIPTEEVKTEEQLREEFLAGERGQQQEEKKSLLEQELDLARQSFEEQQRRQQEAAADAIRRQELLAQARTTAREGVVTNANLTAGIALAGQEYLNDLERQGRLDLQSLIIDQSKLKMDLDEQQQKELDDYITKKQEETRQANQDALQKWQAINEQKMAETKLKMEQEATNTEIMMQNRDFEYQKFRDAVGDDLAKQRFAYDIQQTQLTQQNIEVDRAYQLYRDAIADIQREKQFNLELVEDQIALDNEAKNRAMQLYQYETAKAQNQQEFELQLQNQQIQLEQAEKDRLFDYLKFDFTKDTTRQQLELDIAQMGIQLDEAEKSRLLDLYKFETQKEMNERDFDLQLQQNQIQLEQTEKDRLFDYLKFEFQQDVTKQEFEQDLLKMNIQLDEAQKDRMFEQYKFETQKQLQIDAFDYDIFKDNQERARQAKLDELTMEQFRFNMEQSIGQELLDLGSRAGYNVVAGALEDHFSNYGIQLPEDFFELKTKEETMQMLLTNVEMAKAFSDLDTAGRNYLVNLMGEQDNAYLQAYNTALSNMPQTGLSDSTKYSINTAVDLMKITDPYTGQRIYNSLQEAQQAVTQAMQTGQAPQGQQGFLGSLLSSASQLLNNTGSEGIKTSLDNGVFSVTPPDGYMDYTRVTGVDGKKQCAEFVNDAIGQKVFGDSLVSKTSKINSNIPTAGSVFVEDVGTQYGHVGFVTKVNPDGTFEVLDVNRNGDGKQGTRTLSVDDVKGFMTNPNVGVKSGQIGIENAMQYAGDNQMEDLTDDEFLNLLEELEGKYQSEEPQNVSQMKSANIIPGNEEKKNLNLEPTANITQQTAQTTAPTTAPTPATTTTPAPTTQQDNQEKVMTSWGEEVDKDKILSDIPEGDKGTLTEVKTYEYPEIREQLISQGVDVDNIKPISNINEVVDLTPLKDEVKRRKDYMESINIRDFGMAENYNASQTISTLLDKYVNYIEQYTSTGDIVRLEKLKQDLENYNTGGYTHTAIQQALPYIKKALDALKG